MTVPQRLEILRRHASQVKWHFETETMKFVGIMGNHGIKCFIGKDAPRADIIRLALSVQTELRGTNAKAKK